MNAKSNLFQILDNDDNDNVVVGQTVKFIQIKMKFK